MDPVNAPAAQPSAANEPAAAPSGAPTDVKPAAVPPSAAPANPKPTAPHEDSRKAPESQPKPSSVHVEKPDTRAREAATAPPATPAPTSPAVSTTAPSASAAAGPCGEKGQTRCPLQAWMEDHLQAAVDHADAPALAKGLTRAASFVPDPSWNAGPQGWAALANAGADAAKNADLAAAKAACKSCHKAWRTKYKQSFRKIPIAE
jgi:hypothetical protein